MNKETIDHIKCKMSYKPLSLHLDFLTVNMT